MDLLRDLLERIASEDSLERRDGATRGSVSEDWEKTIREGDSENAASIAPGQVDLYPAVMSDEAHELYQELVRQQKKDQGSIQREDLAEEVKQLEDMDKTEIDDVASFYDSLISDRHASLLRICLYLQRIVKRDDLSLNKPVDAHKGDLRDDFGHVAIYMNHLVSSGYFNDDGFFREMYDELKRKTDAIEERYQEEFEPIVEHELLAFYVGSDYQLNAAKNGLMGTIHSYSFHSPYQSFVDLRGLGDDCEDIIEEVLDKIDEEHEDLLYMDLGEDSEETAIRFFPDSMAL